MTKQYKNNPFLFVAIGVAGINLLKIHSKNKHSFDHATKFNNITNTTCHNESELGPFPGETNSLVDNSEL